MQVHWRREPVARVTADWLVVGVFEDQGPLPDPARLVDEATDGLISRLRQAGDITGEVAERYALAGLPGLAAQRLMVLGLGRRDQLKFGTLNRAVRAAAKQMAGKKRGRVAFCLLHGDDIPLTLQRQATATVQAALVGSHGPELFKKEPKRHAFDELVLVVTAEPPADRLHAAVERGRTLGQAVNLARDLVNQPPRRLTPAQFAGRAAELASQAAMECTVFDEQRIAAERMGALLGVAAGSDQPPRFLAIDYRGAEPDQSPMLALVGKGITFDSGGLSLKQSSSMEEMKGDMAGAATVLAAMVAIAELGLPARVMGLAALTENMPGPGALKVGDVLTARNGKTIEVMNTDAEGRLILADALAYAADRGADHIVDLATLTGSCMVALGRDVAGMMSNNRRWAETVQAAADRAGERLWPLPLDDDYKEQLKSHVADLKNVGTRWGGAITAAKFLEQFVADKPWVHLDIAGPAWAAEDSAAQDAGGTGAFVTTLVELADQYAEQGQHDM